MTGFNRGLDDRFVDALNEEYEKHSWWSKLVDDNGLYIGIRNNYLNVYFAGGSILELHHRSLGGFTGITHFKYLLNLSREQAHRDYVKFKNGQFDPVSIKESYTDIARDIGKIKDAASHYQGDEKKGVHRISIEAKNVIDVEIQIPGERRRIDFATLQWVNDNIEIVFYEAKLYSNGDIRGVNPKVCEQIREYESMLSRRCEEIAESYSRLVNNIVSMNGWRQRRDEIFMEAANRNLSVNPKVRLAIFDFDDPQKNAANSADGLFTKLKCILGEDRVVAAGRPQDLKSKIKSPA
ncbi:MAG: hypothetical protein OXN81_07310 [Alphaproteobacteria bacterium]|nr:hypothetical protein [Alphaproteobacteria bacterium]